MEHGLHIMVLDDEAIVGKRLKPALEKNGHEVEIYQDPREALSRLDEKLFDIVVSDVRMEEVSGLEVLEAVRAHSDRTQVILITGYATIEMGREALLKGAFDFVAKPFKPNDLRAVIDRASQALAALPPVLAH